MFKPIFPNTLLPADQRCWYFLATFQTWVPSHSTFLPSICQVMHYPLQGPRLVSLKYGRFKFGMLVALNANDVK